MDLHSTRFASGRISLNLDPQVVDGWHDTTGELHCAQRPGRCKARDALSMPRGQQALRNGRPPLLGKRSIKFHPDFQANAPVPIDGDVATGARLPRTHCIPDQPTALRHDARKLGRARMASDHSERQTIELVELDCSGRQWTLPYDLGPEDTDDRMRLMALATAFVTVTLMSVSAAEIHVMSGGAPKEVFALLAPKFEQQTGNKVRFTYAVITELRGKLGAGATADVLVLPTPVLDSLANDGKVRADSRTTFGTVSVSVVVKEGAPRPDISSKKKFRDAMLAARSVVHATPGKTPSGTHMGKVMEQLGIADAMAKKVILKPALDGGVQLVTAGQVEIGIYPASEVAGVEGLIVIGPLPAEINLEIVYGAAVTTDSAAPNAASAFVKFMAAPENRAVWQEGGFEPPTNLNSN